MLGEGFIFVQLETYLDHIFFATSFYLCHKRSACRCHAQLEQLVLSDILKGSNPAASAHVHLFVFGKSQKLFELIFGADSSKGHRAQSACASDALMWLYW